MRRVAGCLVVLLATAAAWVGCREGLGLERQLAIGSGTDTLDSAIDIGGEPGSGTDTIDAMVDDVLVRDVAIFDVGGEPGGSDAAIDAGIDTGGGGSDAATDAATDAGDAGATSDAPGSSPAGDANGGVDGQREGSNGRLDQTSFYACAGGSCGSTAGAEAWLPIAIAVGTAIRRRRQPR